LIGLDTNVVVRYLAQDDARPSAVATRFIEGTLTPENPGFIACVTLCEIAWVLAESYGAGRARVREVIEKLLTTKQLMVESADLVWKALKAWDGTSADFSDALIGEIARAHGGGKVVTFDKSAAKLEFFELLA
jgi:predicted nucleic-acid-binding protein